VNVICPTTQVNGLRHFNTTGKSREQRKILSSEEQLLDLVPQTRSAAFWCAADGPRSGQADISAAA